MASDPGEEVNLAADEPVLVAQLDALITQHLIDTEALVPNFNQNYAPPTFDRWTPNDEVWVHEGVAGALKMVSNSFLPALDSPDLTSLPTPTKVRVKMTSRSYGDGRIWWRNSLGDDWSLVQSVPFAVSHDNVALTIEIPISPRSLVAQIHYLPSSEYFQTEVVFIEVLDGSGTVIESMARTDSDGDGTSAQDATALRRDSNDA